MPLLCGEGLFSLVRGPTTMVKLIVLLALVCACADAYPNFQHKDRIADVAPEEPINGMNGFIRYCHMDTPCAWRVFIFADLKTHIIPNNYCVCPVSYKCRPYSGKPEEGLTEMRCFPPGTEELYLIRTGVPA